MYYVGVLINGLPKLKKLTPDNLQPQDGEPGSPMVFCTATLEDETVVIPELEELTRVVSAAVYDQ